MNENLPPMKTTKVTQSSRKTIIADEPVEMQVNYAPETGQVDETNNNSRE